MSVRSGYCRWLLRTSLPLSAIALIFVGCERSGSKPADSSANSSDTAELFTIPHEQMAHVQVLTVQPTTLARTLRLTGAVAYNSFHTTPVITQVSGPVSRIVVVPGRRCKRASPCCTWRVPIIRNSAPTI